METEDTAYDAYVSAQKTFMALDHPTGVIRHAKFIESRFRCLIITRDNLQTFLNSIIPKRLAKLRSALIPILRSSILFKLKTINNIERLWTLSDRGSVYGDASPAMFLTSLNYTTYLSPQWNIVRELHVIALDKDVLEQFFDDPLLNFKNWHLRRHEISESHDAILKTIRGIRNRSVGHNLLAAIRRLAYTIRTSRIETKSLGTRPPLTRNLVDHLYKSFQKGLLDPTESFLRGSGTFEQVQSHSAPSPAVLRASEDGVVLIHAVCHPREPDSSKAIICAYFIKDMSSPPNTWNTKSMIKSTFEKWGVYHTTRDNGNSTWTDVVDPKNCAVPWNIADTDRRNYGVSTDGLRFQAMIDSHKSPTPMPTLSTQGLRGIEIEGSGSFICLDQCMEGSWFDQRHEIPALWKVKFITYKIARAQILCNTDHIIRCCIHCAVLNAGQISRDCNCTCASQWVKQLVHGGIYDPIQANENERILGAYPLLNLPFDDIPELYLQFEEFLNWCLKLSRNMFKRSTKRSQIAYEDSEDHGSRELFYKLYPVYYGPDYTATDDALKEFFLELWYWGRCHVFGSYLYPDGAQDFIDLKMEVADLRRIQKLIRLAKQL
jgi:hypothetical protein